MKRAACVCATTCVVLTFVVLARGPGNSEEALCEECSRYSFHSFGSSDDTDYWNKPELLCKKKYGAELASMESEVEWEVVTNFLKKNHLHKNPTEWYIGLKKEKLKDQWCWQSNNKTCINTSDVGTWRWQSGEPTGDGLCVVMARNYPSGSFGRYNDLVCHTPGTNRGYMCEKNVDCSDKVLSNGHLLHWNINCQSTVQPFLRTEARITFFTTKPVAKESFATTEPKNKSQDTVNANNADQSTTTNLVTDAVTSGIIPGGQPQSTDASLQNSGPTKASTKHRPSPYEPKATKESTSAVLVVILSVVVLLIIALILVGVVVFFWRKRNSNIENQGTWYHVDIRDEDARDPSELRDEFQTSVTYTVSSQHGGASREEEELETYENMNLRFPAKEENKDATYSVVDRASTNSTPVYDNITTNKQKSDISANSSASLQLGGGLEMNERIDGEAATEREERLPVYTVVRKGMKRPASAHSRITCQKKEFDKQWESCRPKCKTPTENCDSLQQETFTSPSILVQLSKEDGTNHSFYAVPDKTKKKPRTAEKRPSCSGLIYAELDPGPSSESSVRPVGRRSFTVYSDVDHVQTALRSQKAKDDDELHYDILEQIAGTR